MIQWKKLKAQVKSKKGPSRVLNANKVKLVIALATERLEMGEEKGKKMRVRCTMY